MLRRPTLLASVASLVAVAATLAPSAGAADADRSLPTPPAGVVAASSSPLQYVAMGDSYSAASGVLPPDPAAPLQCLRSSRNYPHVIAERVGAQLTDVTCGAAETKDYRESQYDGVAPQLDALSRRTELVTMTIGGNDSGVFINAIAQCGAAGLSTLGTGSPCRDRYGSSFEDTIRTTTYPSLVRALRDVRKRAPRAEVAILGYPWILPRTVGCFDKLPVAEGDVPYLRSLQGTLNDAVRRAAGRTGATYVDLNRVSEGHDACQPIGTRWVEPVLQTTNPVVVHPNALGEERMAARTIRVLDLLAGAQAGPQRAADATPGAKVLKRYDAVVAFHDVPSHPAAPLRKRVKAIVRYAAMGADTDARVRLQLFRDQVAQEKREGDLTRPQAKALKRFSRRAADILGL